jgi:hypothetical protein
MSITMDGGKLQVVARLSGVAAYLDNWAIIELANGPAARRRQFVSALRRCGSLLFSFTNALELAEVERGPGERVREFLDEIGPNWIPLALNPWTVADRETTGDNAMTPCISRSFIEAFFRDRLYELSPGGSKIVDMSADTFFALRSVMNWTNAQKESIRRNSEEIDELLIEQASQNFKAYKTDASMLDSRLPPVPYARNAPARFALMQLLRKLAVEAKTFQLKRGDGRDLCHAVLGSAYGSFAALDRHWKRRVDALPTPNQLARIYSPTELDTLVTEIDAFANTHCPDPRPVVVRN